MPGGVVRPSAHERSSRRASAFAWAKCRSCVEEGRTSSGLVCEWRGLDNSKARTQRRVCLSGFGTLEGVLALGEPGAPVRRAHREPEALATRQEGPDGAPLGSTSE